MTLTNYWWLLIWLPIGTIFCNLVIPKKTEIQYGQKVNKWRFSSALILFLPYIIWAGFRSLTDFGDTAAYKDMFNAVPGNLSEMLSYAAEQTKDRGYSVLMTLFKVFVSNSYVVFFVTVAIIQGICIIYVFRKYSTDYAFSIFIFVASGDYVGWMHSGIRQFLVVAIIMACIPLILKKRYVPVIALILILSTIHMSALMLIPFIFIAQGKAWGGRTVFVIGCTMLAVLFVDNFTGILTTIMENTQYSGATAEFASDDGVNIFRVLVFSVPTIISFVLRRRIRAVADPAMNYFVNCALISSCLYIIGYFTSGLLFGRLPIYFSVTNPILLAMEFDLFFEKRSASMIKFATVICYCAYFYYQMHITYGLL